MLTSLNVDDLDVGDEAGRAVHVPHPRVLEAELEVDATVLVAGVDRHRVGQVEATLGLDDELEHRQDVAVLLVELELDLGFVPLEVLGTHASPRSHTASLREPRDIFAGATAAHVPRSELSRASP